MTRAETLEKPKSHEPQTDRRQFVNFIFYKVADGWRLKPREERERGVLDFVEAVRNKPSDLMLYGYSTFGIRSDADLMLWRISYRLESFQELSAAVLKTGLGAYLNTSYSYLSVTKRSTYVESHQHPGQEGARVAIVPAQKPYIFVYPFVKTRAWYLLPKEKRQEAMTEHIAIGHKYPSIKINTTYSFGIDDQEFVVAFEADRPQDFVDCVMELRESEASKYTVRDTPSFTCVRKDLDAILKEISSL